MQVLGASLGSQCQELTENECKRRDPGLALAQRIGLLPCSVALKQRLASTGGLGLNGKDISAEDRRHLRKC